MASDDCLPGPLKDFVFDLHDSVRTSQIPAEQVVFLGNFRELTSKVNSLIIMHVRWFQGTNIHVVTLLTRVHRKQLAYPTNTLVHKSILRRVRGRLLKQFPMNVEETNSSLPSTRNSLRGIFTPSRAPMHAIALMGGLFTNLSLIKS